MTSNSSGAAHGGMGAIGTAGTYGSTYGSITAPTNIGSGGYDVYGSEARGGGAIRLRVAGDSTVSGTISAVGVPPTGSKYYAGGSGGSIFLTTASLSGDGLLRADGGDMTSSKAGGGGRIAVIVTNAPGFGDVSMHAFTGQGKTTIGYAAPGTVYLESTAHGAGNGLLLIDADNKGSTATTLLTSNVTDTVVGTVIVTNQAKFEIADDQSLTVNGDWLNTATFIGSNTGATVDFASTNAATVTANNTFYDLTAGAEGKTISFEAGKTNTVNGKLTFRDDTTLLSTADGNYTYLVLSPGGTQEVGRVTVKDNHAGMNGGQEIVAALDSQDLGNNVNWRFLKRVGSLIILR